MPVNSASAYPANRFRALGGSTFVGGPANAINGIENPNTTFPNNNPWMARGGPGNPPPAPTNFMRAGRGSNSMPGTTMPSLMEGATTPQGLAARAFQGSQRIGYRGDLPGTNALDNYDANHGIGQTFDQARAAANGAPSSWNAEPPNSADFNRQIGFGAADGLPGQPATPAEAALLPARADGGDVQAGQPTLVGENGPEVMVPQQNGVIIPNLAGNAKASNPPPAPTAFNSDSFVGPPTLEDRANEMYTGLSQVQQKLDTALGRNRDLPPPAPVRGNPFAMTAKEKALAATVAPASASRDSADVELARQQVRDHFGETNPSSTPNMDALPPWNPNSVDSNDAPYDAAIAADAALQKNGGAPSPSPAPASPSVPPPAPTSGQYLAASPALPAYKDSPNLPPPAPGYNPTAAANTFMAGLFGPSSAPAGPGSNPPPAPTNAGQVPMSTPGKYAGTRPPVFTPAPNNPPPAPAAALQDPRVGPLQNQVQQLQAGAAKQDLRTYHDPLGYLDIAANNGHTEGASKEALDKWNSLPFPTQSALRQTWGTRDGRVRLASMHTDLELGMNKQGWEQQKHADTVSHQHAQESETNRHNAALEKARNEATEERRRNDTLLANSRDFKDQSKARDDIAKFEEKQQQVDDMNRTLTARFQAAQAKKNTDQMKDINSVLESTDPKTKETGMKWLDSKYPAEKHYSPATITDIPGSTQKIVQGEGIKLAQGEKETGMTQSQAMGHLAANRTYLSKLMDDPTKNADEIKQVKEDNEYLRSIAHPAPTVKPKNPSLTGQVDGM